jgi:hypothetical protein
MRRSTDAMRALAAVCLLLGAGAAGCGNTQGRVLSLTNPESAALGADDVVRIMQRAGFSDDQVLQLGTDLRNTLASTGAAKIMVGKKVEAIIAADGNSLHVTSRQRGSFTYDLEKHEFR